MHKKYTYKDGKKYGPYLYQNKRVGEHVVTSYFGKEGSNNGLNRKTLFAYFLIFIATILFVISMNIPSSSPTGKVSLEVDQVSYNEGELLSGVIRFNLREGEFIPSNSIVRVRIDGEKREYLLSDLTGQDETEGKYYAENSDITGTGKGYGKAGMRKTPAEINFELAVVDSLGQEKTISGKVSKGNDFVYSGDFVSYSILPGSVRLDGEIVDFSAITSEDNTDEIRITTDYEDKSKGYGQEYLGEYGGILVIPVDEFNLTAENDDLIVELLYDNKVIASADKEIMVKDSGDENLQSNGRTVSITKEIPDIRMPLGKSVTLNLNDYFSGATSYSFEASDLVASIEDGKLKISAEDGFKGTRNAKVTAYSQSSQIKSNDFEVVVSSSSIDVRTTNSQVKIGENVKWTKQVSLENSEAVSIEIPVSAENVEVKSIENGVEKKADASVSSLTGNVVIEIDLKEKQEKKKESSIGNFFKKIINSITGNAVAEINVNDVLPSQEVKEVLISDSATQYVIEYETPAPLAYEETTESGKRVVISAPDELGYTDVLSFASVPEVYTYDQKDSIKLYWVEDQSYLSFDAYDLDNNGKIDYIEWITPHLSNQTFEIILITRAQHLDSNRAFVSDIYDQVGSLDNIYSSIPANDYVRVSFERNLTSANDISIYARSNSSAQIEVYEKDSDVLLARFDNIAEFNKYQILLTSLQSYQETFDLKIVGDSVDFDYIVDPSVSNFCYQESANVSTSCGGLSTGVYSGNAGQLNSSWYDGDWNSYAAESVDGAINFIYINYTKPVNATFGSMWQVGDAGGIFNLSISQSCWNFNNTALLFRIEATYAASSLEQNTLIETAEGYKKIKDINEGDEVYSFNSETGQNEFKKVKSVKSMSLALEGGVYYNISYIVDGQTNSILSTYNHKFYANGEFIAADSLKAGDVLTNIDLSNVLIDKIELVPNTVDFVWDIVVEDNHNFFANGILVHNIGHGVEWSCRGSPTWVPLRNYPVLVRVNEEAMIWNITNVTGIAVTINNPQNTIYNSLPIPVNVTLDVPGQSVKYTLDNGVTNYSLSTIDNYNYNASISALSDGNYALKIYVNDSNGYGNYTQNRAFSYMAPLTACGTLSVANAIYSLANDISGVLGTCFIIGADNVTIDGNGHYINGTDAGSSYGIWTAEYSYTTIKNFAGISQFETGIYSDSSTGVNIINNSVLSNNYGIFLGGSSNSIVLKNYLNNNIVTNIKLSFSSSNSIKNNSVVSGNDGIYLTITSNNNNLSFNNITGMARYGFWVENSNRNLLSDNSVKSGSTDSVFFDNSLNNTLFNPQIYGFNNYALHSFSGPNLLVFNNSFGNLLFIGNQNAFSINADLTFPGNIIISDNSIFLNQSSSLNTSANLSLYNIGERGYSIPVIKRDGAICTNCYNFTSLNASTVIFNVSGVGNYSIGDAAAITSCGALTYNNTLYVLQNDLNHTGNNCLDLTDVKNITVDGNGHTINGNSSASSVALIMLRSENITAYNLRVNSEQYGVSSYYSGKISITNFSVNNSIAVGMLFSDSSYVNVSNNLLYNNPNGIYYLTVSGNNYILNNYVRSSSYYGIRIDSTSNVTVMNNTVYQSGSRGIYSTDSLNMTISYNNITSNPYGISVGSFVGNSMNNTLLNNLIVNSSNSSIVFDRINYVIYNNSYGQIKWFALNSSVNGSITFPGSINISNNSAIISPTLAGLNSSANISLIGIATDFVNPNIYKDYQICTNCYNFTSLNAGTVIFNMSEVGNYSILDTTSLFSCGTLSVNNSVYNLVNDIIGVSGSCFNITASNVTLNGNGHLVSSLGSPLSVGVSAQNVNGITIKNLELGFFTTGIALNDVSTSLIRGNTLYRSSDQGISMVSSFNNNVSGNLLIENNDFQLLIGSGSYSNYFVNNTMNNTASSQSIMDLSGDSLDNYLFYSNVYGQIKWIDFRFLRNMTVRQNLSLGSSVIIEDNNIGFEVDPSTLGSSRINNGANITIFSAPAWPGNYKQSLFGISENGDLRCRHCYNFTNLLVGGNQQFNVSYVGAEYSIGLAPRSKTSVPLGQGWNLFGITTDDNYSVGSNVTITLQPGRNYIGYSGAANLSRDNIDVYYENGTLANFTTLLAQTTIFNQFAYYDSIDNRKRFKYAPLDDQSLRTEKGYIVDVNDTLGENLDVTFVGSGGSNVADTYAWADLMFMNESSGQVLNITQAYNNGASNRWIDLVGFVWDENTQSFKTICEVDENEDPFNGCNLNTLSTWNSYQINSQSDDIVLLRQD